MDRARPLVMGHRANTPRWIRVYLREGAQALEVDVYQRGGRVLVLHPPPSHRPRLARERLGNILGSLHLYPETPLEEHLQHVPPGVPVMLDLKGRVEPGPLLRSLERAGRGPGDVVVATRRHDSAPGLEAAGFRVLLSLDCRPQSLAALAPRGGAAGVTVNHVYVDEGLVGEARSLGWLVAAWRVNRPGEARRLAGLGVDVLITDYPALVLRALDGFDK